MKRSRCLLLVFLLAVHARGGDERPENVDKNQFHLFNPTPEACLRPMTIDGPGATESPYTVDAGHFQIEATFFGYSSYGDLYQGAMYRLEVWDVGPINLKLGLLNSLDLQLVLEPHRHIFEREVLSGYYGYNWRQTREGFGDTAVRLKYNLWGNDGGRTALAVTPFVTIPTSGAGVGNSNVEGGFLLTFEMQLPRDFYLGVTSGLGTAEKVLSSGGNTTFRNSIALSRELFWGLEAYVEYFSVLTTERGAGRADSFDSGLAYWLTDNLQVNGGFNLGLTSWADDWYAFTGMAWRY